MALYEINSMQAAADGIEGFALVGLETAEGGVVVASWGPHGSLVPEPANVLRSVSRAYLDDLPQAFAQIPLGRRSPGTDSWGPRRYANVPSYVTAGEAQAGVVCLYLRRIPKKGPQAGSLDPADGVWMTRMLGAFDPATQGVSRRGESAPLRSWTPAVEMPLIKEIRLVVLSETGDEIASTREDVRHPAADSGGWEPMGVDITLVRDAYARRHAVAVLDSYTSYHGSRPEETNTTWPEVLDQFVQTDVLDPRPRRSFGGASSLGAQDRA